MEREYRFEICNDKEYEFGVRVRCVTIVASNIKGALKKFRKQFDASWEIYQVCRKFSDCKLEQPVYDYFNGYLFSCEKETMKENYSECY